MHKPRLVILASTPDTAQRLYCQYREIFDRYLNIQYYSFQNVPVKAPLTADLVLITHQAIQNKAMQYVSPDTSVLIARRSISFDSIKLLYDIPEGTNVVIANVDRRNTLDALEQIKALGITHLNYAPYYPSIPWPGTQYRHAVIFGEQVLPPEKRLTVLDMGTRISDITTCTLVAQHFNILEKLQDTIEAAFMKTNIRLAYVYFEQLQKSRELHRNIQTLLDYYEKCILLMNEPGSILFHNRRAKRLLDIDENGRTAFSETLFNHFSAGDSDFFTKIDDENYYVTLYVPSGSSSIFVTIEDVENIEMISSKYKGFLKSKGLVAEYSFYDIVCQSAEMKSLIKRAQQFAKSDSTIYISGESGCGKELFAQAIHNASKRRKEAFVAVNFAALSPSLSEAELFGYVEGAFTGAKKGGEKGLFELADKGTIFLDEIGDCSLDIQKKILRVIQERKVMPIGSNRWIPIDIRIISATNQNLEKLVSEKKFREDLYYRLNVLPITIPPLRERREDILLLFYTFLNEFLDTKVQAVELDLEGRLEGYSWKGNVRELRSVAEYIANCISADAEGWESEVKNMLCSRETGGGLPSQEIETLHRLETSCEIYSAGLVLKQLNTPPYQWTRKTVHQALPQVSESVIKKIFLLLRKEDLVISKQGEGTRITTKGRKFLNYIEKNGMCAL